MHVHCLHWLMSTGLLCRVCFSEDVNPRLVKWHPWRAPIWQWDLIWLSLSAYICLGLVVEYWPFVGACGRYSHSKLHQFCHLAFWFSLCYHPPHSCAPPAHSFIYTGPILKNSWKNHQKLVKISHYLLAMLVAQKVIDN